MKKYIITIICAILVVGLGVFSFFYFKDDKINNDMTKVKVSEVTRSVFYAPQYVAINKGFFEKQNIEIELTTGQGADKVMTAVLANQSDIGFAGPEASIYVYNEGKEDYTQVFAQMTKKDGSFLVSKTKQDNFNWKNLKGGTVIPGRKGGVPYMTLEYVIKQSGLNPSTDLVLDDSIKFDLMAGAFTGGNADYVTLFEPTASMTENAGKGYIVASVGEASGEIPYTAYFAKKSYIKNNSDVVKRFVTAVYEGQTWVKEHSSKEIAEAIVSFFPDTDLALLETVIERYKGIDVWSDTPVLKEESFDLLQTVMEEAGELKVKAPYDKIVNNSYASEVIK
ncbi:MAG: ABC transporter substrate-binding protein [Clostridia bacterium]|nr:ABC transporter substrate-binding protein [Clostridia bacterium]